MMCLAAVLCISSPFGSIIFSSFSALAASSSSLKGDIGNTGQAVNNKKMKGEASMGTLSSEQHNPSTCSYSPLLDLDACV